MKKLFYLNLFFLALACWFANFNTAHAAYSYYRQFTVTSTASVASGTNANFPVLVSSTLASWKSTSTGAGARIQNLCTAPNGGTEPCDFIFVTSTPTVSGSNWNCGTALNFETEKYTSSTGALIDWVNVPSISTGTVIYACYGDATVTTDQSHPSGTWNANYLAVYHLPNGTTLNASDSTSYARDLSNIGGTTATSSGEIDGAANMVHASVQYLKSTQITTSTALSWEGWVNAASLPSAYNTAFSQNADGNNYFDLHVKNNGTLAEYMHTTTANVDYDGTGSHTLSTGTWYHLGMTYDSTNGLVGYVNGALDGTAAANGAVNTAIVNSLNLGSNVPSDNTRSWDGKLDEARLSNVALSSQWMLTSYNNQNSPSTFYTVGAEQAVSGGGTNTGEGAFLCSVYQMTSYLGTFQ